MTILTLNFLVPKINTQVDATMFATALMEHINDTFNDDNSIKDITIGAITQVSSQEAQK